MLYSSTQHAREWISTEVNRRLLTWYIERWRANDRSIRRLLKDTELWFVLVANPDGYQYTFDAERLWRKNLRDNDGDGVTTVADGVDPNRNYPNHFKFDEEGSSSIMSSQTYRGESAVSEAETVALKGLLDRVDSRSRSTGTRPANGCCTPRAGRPPRRPRTTRSTSRCPATSTSRRSTGSTRA